MSRALNAISLFVGVVFFGLILYKVIPTSRPEILFVSPNNAGFALQKVIHEISQAKRTIDVAVYMLTNREIISALKLAEARGVKVTVLYGEESPFGTKVPRLHTKLMVIDKRRAIVGSANFTEAGFGYNKEVLIFINTGEFNSFFREAK